MTGADPERVSADRLRELFRRALDAMPEEPPSAEWLPLTTAQIAALEAGGSRSDDWSGVELSPGSDPARISCCRFHGNVRLDLRPRELPDGSRIPALLQDSTLEDSETGRGCRIVSTGLVRGLRIGEGAAIERCGRVSFRAGSRCGSGRLLELGVESGERSVGSFPLLDVETAAALSGGPEARSALAEYRLLLDAFLDSLASRRSGTVGALAELADTPVIEDCYIGTGVTVSAACALRESTLLGGGTPARVADGALVRGSILKWGSSVESMAIVEGSVVDEASSVERHGKLTASLLGPNSALAEGEITASLAGPFTAAHHQSLLIAARWPGGRGNLGYGANVGSNHTSRLADQEIRPGEGMFFGLGCSVKYPSDFGDAPYSIVATGVTTLPQRMAFPFSLLCEPFSGQEDVPPAFNQILPAWVLYGSFYTVVRNERKFRLRNRAGRWRGETRILRGEITDLLECALARLEAAVPAPVHLPPSIPGLGSNFLLEADRLIAMETYRFHLGFHALRVFAALLGEGMPPGELLETPSGDPERERCRRRIGSLYPGEGPEGLLSRLSSMWSELALEIAESRERDDLRGARIIDDYAEFHDGAALDPVVLEFRAEADAARSALDELLRRQRS